MQPTHPTSPGHDQQDSEPGKGYAIRYVGNRLRGKKVVQLAGDGVLRVFSDRVTLEWWEDQHSRTWQVLVALSGLAGGVLQAAGALWRQLGPRRRGGLPQTNAGAEILTDPPAMACVDPKRKRVSLKVDDGRWVTFATADWAIIESLMDLYDDRMQPAKLASVFVSRADLSLIVVVLIAICCAVLFMVITAPMYR